MTKCIRYFSKQDNQTPMVLRETPQTGKPTNWNTRARKNTTPILCDSDEKLPTNCIKL